MASSRYRLEACRICGTVRLAQSEVDPAAGNYGVEFENIHHAGGTLRVWWVDTCAICQGRAR